MDLASDQAVIRIVETLLAVQKMKLQTRTLIPAQVEEAQRLCATVPAGLLEQFNRLLQRGKNAVAVVRNGVCSECHLQLPSGTLAGLAYTTEIHLCNNCGRFLYLPKNEPPGSHRAAALPPPAKVPVNRSRKRAATHVA